jgi:hypothetical protein
VSGSVEKRTSAPTESLWAEADEKREEFAEAVALVDRERRFHLDDSGCNVAMAPPTDGRLT